jgi:hypothetical protein
MCECDGNISPLPLGSHKGTNILNGFENIIEFEDGYREVEMEVCEYSSKETVNHGNLEFYQKDQRTLHACCLYCGFDEKVL